MLIRWADVQSLAYMVLYPALIVWQWINGIHWLLYLIMLILSVGLAVVQHNHTHLRMWRSTSLNRLTDGYLSLLQGIPSYVFFPSHIGNHHRFNHGPDDETRTYRFGGHHNHFIGYLLHPFQALFVVVPTSLKYLKKRTKKGDYQPVLELVLIGCSMGVLASVNLQLWFVLVVLPQMHGLHWLLGANYLQHAGARPSSGPESSQPSLLDYSRNFTGAVNFIWFNIGFHSAHHESPRAHWSDLPRLHKELELEVPSWLVERSLGFYMMRWMNVFSRTTPRNFLDAQVNATETLTHYD